MSKNLTIQQAFISMYRFLRLYKGRTKSIDIGCLLSDMSTLTDGSTADPAAWIDWTECVERVIQNGEGLESIRAKQSTSTQIAVKGRENAPASALTEQQAFTAMYRFLELYYAQISSKEVKKLLDDMATQCDNSTTNPNAWKDWLKCTKRVIDDNEGMNDIQLRLGM